MVLDISQGASFHRWCRTLAGQNLCAVLTHISPQVQVIFGGCLIWLALVRTFRWKRYNDIHRQFQAKYDEKTITPEEAQKIIQVSMMYDMPLLLYFASAYAFLQPCVIVNIFRPDYFWLE